MADVTSILEKVKAPYTNYGKVTKDEIRDIDVAAAELTDLADAGTHNLLTIPVGYALLDAYIVVKADGDSAGDAATLQFKIGAETLTAVIPQADLVAGKVIKLDGNQYSGVVTEVDGVITPAVQASGVTGVEGSNNGITYTADVAGVDGNEIYVQLIDPAGNDQSLAVTVEGQNVKVSLATGPAGAITSTAAEVIAAVNAALNCDVTADNTGASTGAAVVTAETVNLTGGVDAVIASDSNTLVSVDVDAGMSAYCPSAVDTLDMVVSGEAFTALRFALITTMIDLDTALGNA